MHPRHCSIYPMPRPSLVFCIFSFLQNVKTANIDASNTLFRRYGFLHQTLGIRAMEVNLLIFDIGYNISQFRRSEQPICAGLAVRFAIEFSGPRPPKLSTLSRILQQTKTLAKAYRVVPGFLQVLDVCRQNYYATEFCKAIAQQSF